MRHWTKPEGIMLGEISPSQRDGHCESTYTRSDSGQIHRDRK